MPDDDLHQFQLPRALRGHGSAAIGASQASSLIPLLVAKVSAVQGLQPGAGAAFVRTSYANNLARYLRRAPRLKIWFRVLGLITFGAGLASTTLAALSKSDNTRIAIAVLGLLVGVITHLVQFWRPGDRAGAFYRARARLLELGWNYLLDSADFAALEADPLAQFRKFESQVVAVENAADTIDEQTDPAPPPSAAPPAGNRRDSSSEQHG